MKDLDNGAFLIKTTHPTFVLLTRIRAEFSDTCINQQNAISQDVLSVCDNITYISETISIQSYEKRSNYLQQVQCEVPLNSLYAEW